jgi:hypothetical protein
MRTCRFAALAATGAALALSAPAPAVAAPVPLAYTGGASAITFSSAVLHGSVNPRATATNYFFQYGPTRAYGAQTPLAPAGNGTIALSVTQPIAGLAAASTYHYRLVALGPAGRTNGADRSFTTPSIPLSLQIAGVPNPVPFGEPFQLEGTLSGSGSASHAIVLQANPFPYTAGFKTLGNPELTSSTGGFSFSVVGLTENTQLRVQTVGAPIVTSSVLLENIAVRVSFHAHRTHRRGRWRLSGTVSPAEPGALVGFQLLIAGGRTVNEGGTSVRAAGGSTTVSSFSRIVRLRHRGVYRALVRISDGAHVSAYSAPVLIP